MYACLAPPSREAELCVRWRVPAAAIAATPLLPFHFLSEVQNASRDGVGALTAFGSWRVFVQFYQTLAEFVGSAILFAASSLVMSVSDIVITSQAHSIG